MTDIPFDPAGAASYRPPASPSPDARLRATAREFEAMAIGEMLRPMLEPVWSGKGKFSGGAGEAAFGALLIQEIGKKLAARGGIGLAGPVADAMQRMQEAKRR